MGGERVVFFHIFEVYTDLSYLGVTLPLDASRNKEVQPACGLWNGWQKLF